MIVKQCIFSFLFNCSHCVSIVAGILFDNETDIWDFDRSFACYFTYMVKWLLASCKIWLKSKRNHVLSDVSVMMLFPFLCVICPFESLSTYKYVYIDVLCRRHVNMDVYFYTCKWSSFPLWCAYIYTDA